MTVNQLKENKVENEILLNRNKSKKCSSTDLSPEAADAMVTILKSSMSNNKILDTPHTRLTYKQIFK